MDCICGLLPCVCSDELADSGSPEYIDGPAAPSWLQPRGARVVRWIETPNAPNCPIRRTSLTFEQIMRVDPIFTRDDGVYPQGVERFLCIPEDREWPPHNYTALTLRYDGFLCMGHVQAGNGHLVIDNIHRARDSRVRMSEVVVALYNSVSPIENLRHVSVSFVIEEQTCNFITKDLYSAWPTQETRTWQHGTPEYFQLMGTRIGRTVAYIVLSGLQRGSRRISRVKVYSCGDGDDTVNLRFDIEPLN
ncbi:uncharacterized protein N7483_005313 [Penicillium malachiteum]|uniref:uncharacterized protein n=1 Tax=Penicillium malachiteum TaxID=1324776 RepID=UPI002548557B|nr:uncharacterized protein N7483_005313 [Penicillium malachiteum]KAJ5730805.1 hypothetical protein N7483_005313 [Penicillium malachiteum]